MDSPSCFFSIYVLRIFFCLKNMILSAFFKKNEKGDLVVITFISQNLPHKKDHIFGLRRVLTLKFYRKVVHVRACFVCNNSPRTLRNRKIFLFLYLEIENRYPAPEFSRILKISKKIMFSSYRKISVDLDRKETR